MGFFFLWVLWPAVVVGSDVCVACFGFWGFFVLWVFWPSVVFSGGGGFRYGVDLLWRMLWFFGFAVEDAKGFLDLGLDAMV